MLLFGLLVQSPDPEMNARALSALADVMQLERSALSRIDMQMNALAPADAMLLMPALSPVTVSDYLFDDFGYPSFFAYFFVSNVSR